MSKTTRLNVNLPTQFFAELKEFAAEAHMSVTMLIRVGLPILIDLIKEAQSGKKIQIVDPETNTIKEVLIPR